MGHALPPFHLLLGAPASPVLLHVPHSARLVPDHVRAGIELDDEALELELDHITDSHTAELAAEAAAAATPTPWRFVNGLSRLVIDPERFPDEREAAGLARAGSGCAAPPSRSGWCSPVPRSAGRWRAGRPPPGRPRSAPPARWSSPGPAGQRARPPESARAAAPERRAGRPTGLTRAYVVNSQNDEPPGKPPYTVSAIHDPICERSENR